MPAARSPLRAAGGDVRDGDVLVAVNGHPVGAVGPGPLLAGLAGKPIAVTLRRAGAERTIAVVPTGDEAPIRYQDWVSGRRAAVHERTDGRIGYVHVPDMMSTGWAEFHRDLKREILRDALVLDTRDNGGGHVSELVIEKLARRPIGGGHGRHSADEYYPTSAPRGPIVSIANEFAGSDGDIVNQAFRSLAARQDRRRAHVGRGDRHRRPVRARRRHRRHPAALLVLVPRRRLGCRELRRRPRHRGFVPAAGVGGRRRSAARPRRWTCSPTNSRTRHRCSRRRSPTVPTEPRPPLPPRP